MTTILNANSLLEIPEVFRKADALKPGQRCEIERVGKGEYRVHVEKAAEAEPKERLIDVLMRSPVKDWWVEPDRSERTSLKPRSFLTNDLPRGFQPHLRADQITSLAAGSSMAAREQ